MNINFAPFVIVLILAVGFAGCSGEPDSLKTVVKGKITVADSLDDSGDYSGIHVTILNEYTESEKLDTLYHEVTNQAGSFESVVEFPEKRYYRMKVSRNGKALGELGLILAHMDTLTVETELPGIEETAVLQSSEHEAMRMFLRADRSFERIRAYANNGALSDSQLVSEVKKWSDLYWEIFEKNEHSIAGLLAAEKSANLLKGWNPEEMLDRIDRALPADYMIPVALDLAKPYIAETRGFEAASDYLDSLTVITSELIFREKITMYFDSSRVKEAKKLLANYETLYADKKESEQWVSRIRYDLNYLAPGVKAPDFSFTTMEGDTVNNEVLNGEVYILEISPLANNIYQNDYDRTVIIHEIYRNYGLKIFTIPLDQSEITVNAFFEERNKLWPIAKLGSFDVQKIIEKFNVVQVPTRLLIDENGVLIRKYEGREFEDVIQGINRAFRNNNSPS